MIMEGFPHLEKSVDHGVNINSHGDVSLEVLNNQQSPCDTAPTSTHLEMTHNNTFPVISDYINSPCIDAASVEDHLAKKALGLEASTKLNFKTPKSTNTVRAQPTQHSLYESIHDDEFDEIFDGAEPTPFKPPVERRVEVDINDVNKKWREKRDAVQKSENNSQSPKEAPAVHIEPNIVVEVGAKIRDQHSESSQIMKLLSGGESASSPVVPSMGVQSGTIVGTDSPIGQPRLVDDSQRVKELEELKSMKRIVSEEADECAENDAESVVLDPDHLQLKLPDGSVVKADVNFQKDETEIVTQEVTIQDIMSMLHDQALRSTCSIQPVIKYTGWKHIKHIIFGPPKLKKNLENERACIFSLAKVQFENSSKLHCAMLQTLYRQLTGTSHDCPRFGGHWAAVGFQGNDPSTDLRACGMLGLFHLLYLLLTNRDLALKLQYLSQHETANFPLAVLSINITRISLQMLREERLNRICNQSQSVAEPFNNLYIGLFRAFYSTWSDCCKSIADMGRVISELESRCRANPKSMLHSQGNEAAGSNTRSVHQKHSADGDFDASFVGVDQL